MPHAIPWVTQLHKDRAAMATVAAGRKVRTFAAAAARLADSRYARELDDVLARLDADTGLDMALARGRRALVHERTDEALRWLMRAQSLASARTPLAAGRVAFLLAAIHLGRDEAVASDAVLAWAEGTMGAKADANADVLHVRALLAEWRGERESATALYRRVLQRANAALTPMTRVLAMRNLAAMLAHAYPRESAGLYAMALATLDAEELDDAVRAAIDNGMGYALLAVGDIDAARLKLEQARAEAHRIGHDRIGVFASFNLAIADELSGDLRGSAERLSTVEQDARAIHLDELVGWTWIRRAWLELRGGERDSAKRTLRARFPPTPRTEHREAIQTLDALIHLEERPRTSRDTVSRLATAYERRGDALSAFTLALWAALSDARTGRAAAARRAVTRSCTIGKERGFRLGTSWWTPELVSLARELAPPELSEFADHLLATGDVTRGDARPDVVIARTGTVSIAGGEVADAVWREGRSGSGVLRRYFRALVSAYPARLDRDELADLLWPDSEGDKAIRNLYDATKDLRRVLARIPGTRLDVTDGRYGLVLDPNVRVA